MSGTFRRAMVTGGAGFLGRRLCRRLLEQGTDVVCVAGPLTEGLTVIPVPRGGPRLEFRLTDMAEPFDVPGQVDLVVHLRAVGAAADYPRYPLETLGHGSVGTRNALVLAARKGARFVLASATEAHGDPWVSAPRAGHHGSLDAIGPRNAFDEATRYAEALTSAYRREGIASTAIARVFNSYGSGMRPDDGRMLTALASQALRGEPVTLTDGGGLVTSLCHADDTVRGLLLLAASDMGGPVNIGSPRDVTVGEIAARIIGLTGSSSDIRSVPPPPDEPRARKPDVTFARLTLGFEPRVPLDEGLAETVDWFRRGIVEPAMRPREEVPAVYHPSRPVSGHSCPVTTLMSSEPS
jgi:dTDP-glucose 4,6-dehydratase